MPSEALTYSRSRAPLAAPKRISPAAPRSASLAMITGRPSRSDSSRAGSSPTQPESTDAGWMRLDLVSSGAGTPAATARISGSVNPVCPSSRCTIPAATSSADAASVSTLTTALSSALI